MYNDNKQQQANKANVETQRDGERRNTVEINHDGAQPGRASDRA